MCVVWAWNVVMIILDFGSGNTCKNDLSYVKRMIDELKAVDTGKHEIVIKWQLFTKAGDNTPLRPMAFEYAYRYAAKLGYQTTASVFDVESMAYLLQYDIPFVKIANRPDLYWLAGEVPRKIPVYVSTGHMKKIKGNIFDKILELHATELLVCVSKYPATLKDYEDAFTWETYSEEGHALVNISDHTTDFTLYHKYKPEIYECHYKLEDSTGLDAGDFARTPEQLAEVL